MRNSWSTSDADIKNRGAQEWNQKATNIPKIDKFLTISSEQKNIFA